MAVEKFEAAPDGGWGWMCALGAGVILFTTAGPPLTFSIIYQALLAQYNPSASLTAGVYITLTSCNMLSSPVVSVLAKRFTCRALAMCGGLLSTCGLVIASQSGTLIGVYIGFGLMLGLGSCMMAMPTHMILNVYFNKRRGRVVGVVSMMGGVAGLTMPQLLTFFLDTYGLHGTFLLWAGVLAQSIVAAALYRPIEIVPSPDQKPLDKTWDKNHAAVTADEVQNPEIVAELPVKDQVTANGREDKSASLDHEEVQEATEPLIITSMITKNDQNHTNGTVINGTEIFTGSRTHLDVVVDAPRVSLYTRNEFGSSILCDDAGDEDHNDDDQNEPKIVNSRLASLRKILLTYIDVTILKRSLFVSTAASVGTISLGLGVGNVYLAPYAEERGFTKTEQAFLVSLRSGMFLVYQPFSGLVFDHGVLRHYRVEMYATLNTMAGLSTALVPLARSEGSVYATWMLVAFFLSWAVAQETVVVAETVPPAKFPTALGFSRFCRGLFSVIGNTIAGIIVDYSGTYDSAYICGGVCLMMPALVLHFVSYLHRRKMRNNSNNKNNNSSRPETTAAA